MNLFVTPINIQIDERTIVTVHNKKEADFYSANMIRIALDCTNLVNTTKNPKVFFERYNLLINKLENLSKLEKFNCFTGESPSNNLREILGKRELTINDFLNRYCEDVLNKIESLKTITSKKKKVDNFFSSLKQYELYMTDNNIQAYHFLYEKMLKIILSEQIEKIHCIYCNKLINKDSKFCTYCGKRQ